MIFVLEDDDSIRNLMLYTLHSAGLEAEGFPDSGPFWDALKTRLPSLILLDIMLPGEDGITILKRLRAGRKTADIPVIMATAKGTEYDRVMGLDLGADDYLSKPFSMLEMVSRVRAVLRRTARTAEKEGKPSPEILRLGDLELNPVSHSIAVQGERVQLTLKEYELLHLFMEKPGCVFTRDDLLAAVWSTDYAGETRTVDVHIRTLRFKLGPCGEYIRTVRGVGYLLEVQP